MTCANEQSITFCMIKTIMYHVAHITQGYQDRLEESYRSRMGEPFTDDSFTPFVGSFFPVYPTCLSIYLSSRICGSDHRGDCISNNAAEPADREMMDTRGQYPPATMIT